METYQTQLGTVFRQDCVAFLKGLQDNSVDLFFADPPFNLSKKYDSGAKDDLDAKDYLEWCRTWLTEGIRVLKPGGSFFIYNLPKWNFALGGFLSERLNFRHAISIKMSTRMPIPKRLYPTHYSLLYMSKGKPSRFKPDRIPMATCPNCYGDLVDYGGHKSKMNPKGVNLTDIWTDTPPVRHKSRKTRGANELPLKLVDRILELASVEDDLICDPFGGSGTTYVVAEEKKRRWVGCEIGPLDSIQSRFKAWKESEKPYFDAMRSKLNALHPPDVYENRIKQGLWVLE